MWYYFWMTNRWLLLNFDALGGLAVLITTLFVLSGFVDAGIAALCMTLAKAFTQSIFYWACQYGSIPCTRDQCLPILFKIVFGQV